MPPSYRTQMIPSEDLIIKWNIDMQSSKEKGKKNQKDFKWILPSCMEDFVATRWVYADSSAITSKLRLRQAFDITSKKKLQVNFAVLSHVR